MKTITTNALEKKLKNPKESDDFLDVRARKEFSACHIPGFKNIPLEKLADHMAHFKGKTVYISCRSGARAAVAAKQIQELGEAKSVECYKESLVGWQKVGKKTAGNGNRWTAIPVQQQFLIILGLILIGLSFAGPIGSALILFISGLLVIAGITGFCPMHEVLKSCPWNKEG